MANSRGRPLLGARRVERALALLDGVTSVDRAHVQSTRARLLTTLAWSHFDMYGLVRGRETLEVALVAAKESAEPGDVALALLQRGLLAARSGSPAEALPDLDEAISMIDQVPPHERPAFYLNRGNVRLMIGSLRQARDDFARSRDLARELGLTRVESKALSNLGYAEYVTGDLAAALQALTAAHDLDADVAHAGQLDRAQVLLEAGLLDEADDALTQVEAYLRRRRANQARAEAKLARAEVALVQQRWREARALSVSAGRDFRRRAGTGWQAKADLVYWQSLLEIEGGPSRVVRAVSLGEAAVNGNGHADPVTDRELALVAAEAHLAMGQAAEAATLVGRAGRVSRTEPLSARLREHLVRAGVARAAGDVRTARRELRTGLSALSSRQARHHSLDLRTAMAVHGNRLAGLDLRIALESRSPGTVFDSLERWRAMSHRRTAITPPSDPELADLLATLRMVTEEIRGTPPGTGIEPLYRRQRTIERRVREREWSLRGHGVARRPTTLRELRPVLQSTGCDVLAYFVLDERLGAVAIRAGKATVADLGAWSAAEGLMARVRADLDALAGRLLPEQLRQAITSSLRHDLDRLDRVLLPDVVARADNLLVVPSRTLGTAPWSLLPSRAGRPTTVSLSATSWLRGIAQPVDSPRVSAMAGPGLLLSDEEVLGVAAIWPGGSAARAQHGRAVDLATAMVSSDLVHIAAHGQHNHDNPLFSSIRMSDGPLYAYDIPADGTVAGHIVLSACDLGLTTPRTGGEVLGLTAALLGIGARSVVSSVSRVDDGVAYEAMLRYHANLASGLDSPTALAAALADGDERPAPFVSFGSPWSAAADAVLVSETSHSTHGAP